MRIPLIALVLAVHLVAATPTMPGVDEFTAGTLIAAGVEPEWLVRYVAQVEQESAFLVLAESPWAKGLAQFTDPTRGDWWKRVPGCEEMIDHPFDPICNLLAMRAYMQWLVKMSLAMPGIGEEAAVIMAQRGYNGGFGWMQREHKLCLATMGCDPNSPADLASVCRAAGRSEASCRENTEYPVRIARKQRRPGWKRKLLAVGKAGVKAASVAGVPGAAIADEAIRRRAFAKVPRR